MKSATVEIAAAILAASIGAFVAGAAGFLCGMLISGVTDNPLETVHIAAPAIAIFFAALALIVIFQRMRVPDDQT